MRRITTLETQQVPFFGDYYMQGIIGAFSRSLSTDLCSVDLVLSAASGTTQHNTQKTPQHSTKALKLM